MITLQELVKQDTRPVSVTVMMTCYNHEKYIRQAIDSVLVQKTDFPVNIVVHDDASTDRSADIIRSYAAVHPNITAVIEETNFYQNGKSFLPVLLPHYTGKYLASCECDDFWIDENKLQIQVDYLERNPDCSAVYSNVMPVDKSGLRSAEYYPKTGEGDYPPDKVLICEHQTASRVVRNFYTFMTPEELRCMMDTKANGDEKILAISCGLGRVHYFREEFAAHRRVTDEGDSFSARQNRLSQYEQTMLYEMRQFRVLAMYETLFGRNKTIYKMSFLRSIVKRYRKNRNAEVQTKNFNSFFSEVPVYMYCMIPFFSFLRRLYKTAERIRKALGII